MALPPDSKPDKSKSSKKPDYSADSHNLGEHLAVIGTGRVGRMTLLTLAHESWIGKLTLVDTKPGLAEAVEEEVRHSLASTRNPMEVRSYDEDQSVERADMVLITAGTPRTLDMGERTDLTTINAGIIEEIAKSVVPRNPNARYVVVTNPVDAMATLFKKISRADWVISTGTNLESQRFRSEISKQLGVPITSVSGFAGGEHGKDAVFLWSTVKIDGLPLKQYLEEAGKTLDKSGIEESVREASMRIIRASGGTRQGPATSFRDILRSIALNENKVLSIATLYGNSSIPEPVMVGIPQTVGRSFGPTLEKFLDDEERIAIRKAARKIYDTYKDALDFLRY